MDKKSSFRTKQILCVPIRVPTGSILGVMQCINTVDDEPFTEQDEKLLELVAQQLGQVLQKVGDESSITFDQMSNVTPTYTLDEHFKLNVRKFSTARLFSDVKKVHRHVKCTITLYHGGIRLGKVMNVMGNPTIKKTHPTNNHDVLVTGDFGAGTGQWVTSSIPLCNLPHGTRIIFQLYSKVRMTKRVKEFRCDDDVEADGRRRHLNLSTDAILLLARLARHYRFARRRMATPAGGLAATCSSSTTA